MLAITGIERFKGSPLSGGEEGTSVGSVFGTAERTTSTTAPETSESAPGDDATTSREAPASTTSEAPEATVTTTSPRPQLVPTGLLPGN
jgi:hypothetical protein